MMLVCREARFYMLEIAKESVSFNDLAWDTQYFGVDSAQAILHRPLTIEEWCELQSRFKEYQFISIVNQNSERINSQLIERNTSEYMVDVNIQFDKELEEQSEISKDILIHQSLKRNEQVIELADFQYSKFTEDPELAMRCGGQVYHQWIINSFDQSKKFF